MSNEGKKILTTPVGDTTIKGDLWFGNLTPAGTFSNIPQLASVTLPSSIDTRKVTTTLQKIQEQLELQAKKENNTTENVLEENAINTFLSNYTKLMIDYSDMRNYVFFGSAYTELAYNINYLITNFPYSAYIAKNVVFQDQLNTYTNPLNSLETIISFELQNVIDGSNLSFINDGKTNWKNLDVVDSLGIRFPITNFENFATNIDIQNIEYSGSIALITLKYKQNLNPAILSDVAIINTKGIDNMNGIFPLITIGDDTNTQIDPTFGILNEFQFTIDTNTTLSGTFQNTGQANLVLITNVNNGTNGIEITTSRPHNVLENEFVFIENSSIPEILGRNHAVNVTSNTLELNNTPNITPVSGFLATLNLNKINITCLGQNVLANSINQLIDVNESYQGLLVKPNLNENIKFNTSLNELQRYLISANAQLPWPRHEITDNIIITGILYDDWISNPTNSVSSYDPNELSYGVLEDNELLSLVGVLSLDEIKTNQMLRRCFPYESINELNDTEQRFFTNFILLAGKFFDLIKVHIDFLKYTKELNYGEFNQLSPDHYKSYAEHYGFNLFSDSGEIDLASALIKTEPGLRYDNLYNALYNNTINKKTLLELQQEKQKRLLINLLYIYSCKGTQSAIEYLTNLIGSPTGLIVLKEYYFDMMLGNKLVDNNKIEVPDVVKFEIDTDYLIDKVNITNPINQPYLFRKVLSNEHKINLREIDIDIDGQNVVEQEVLKYGKIKYNYGKFDNGTYANLQGGDPSSSLGGYFLLPLSFPDKYTGVTVEYMIPRDGFTKGVSKNYDEVSIHIASLIKVGKVNNILTPINYATEYAYQLPLIYQESSNPINIGQALTSYNTSTTQEANIGIDIIDLGVGTITLALSNGQTWTTNWSTSPLGNELEAKRQTAQNIVNEINKTDSDYRGYLFWNFEDQLPTVVITTKLNTYPLSLTITNASGTIVLNNNYGNQSNPGYFSQKVNQPSLLPQGIIVRLEGKDLVVRYRVREEVTLNFVERIAIIENFFEEDGINHQLRLIYRVEGIEVYKDYDYLGLSYWKTLGNSSIYNVFNIPKKLINGLTISFLPKLFYAYSDNEPSSTPGALTACTGKIKIPYVGDGAYHNVEIKVNGVSAISVPFGITYATGGNNANALATLLTNNINAFVTYPEFTATVSGNEITLSTLTTSALLDGVKIELNYSTPTGRIVYTSTNMDYAGRDIIDGSNYGIDQLFWWDLFIGLPSNINFLFKRVAINEQPTIDHSDTIDFGLNENQQGYETEKFSFDFTLQDATKLKEVNVPAQYKSMYPYLQNAPATVDDLEQYLTTNYTDNIITDIRLVSKKVFSNQVNSAFTIQQIQECFENPLKNIDDLFKYNAWAKTIHSDYTYTNYNNIFENYFKFSSTTITYLSLLPFIELIKDQYKPLVESFIPIVINLSSFGELIRPLIPAKVHYTKLYKDCHARRNYTPSVISFTVLSGENDSPFSPNTLTFDFTYINFGPYSFISNANTTLNLILDDIELQTSGGITGYVSGNTIVFFVDPGWFLDAFGVDPAGVLVRLGVDPTIILVEDRGLLSDYITPITPNSYCAEILYSIPQVPEINSSALYIYEENENQTPLYIYNDSEGGQPIYI